MASICLCQTQGEEEYACNVTKGNRLQSWAESEFVPRSVETKVSATDSVNSRAASDSPVVLRAENCITLECRLGQIDCSFLSHL